MKHLLPALIKQAQHERAAWLSAQCNLVCVSTGSATAITSALLRMRSRGARLHPFCCLPHCLNAYTVKQTGHFTWLPHEGGPLARKDVGSHLQGPGLVRVHISQLRQLGSPLGLPLCCSLLALRRRRLCEYAITCGVHSDCPHDAEESSMPYNYAGCSLFPFTALPSLARNRLKAAKPQEGWTTLL